MTRLAAALVYAAVLASAVSAAAQSPLHLSSAYQKMIAAVRSGCEDETRAAFTGNGYVKVEDQETFISDRAEQILRTSVGKDAAFMRRVAASMKANDSAQTRLNGCVEEVLARRRASSEVDPMVVANKNFAAGQGLIEAFRPACAVKRDFEVGVLAMSELQGEAEYHEDQRALSQAPQIAAKSPPSYTDSYIDCLILQRTTQPAVVKEFLTSCAAELSAWKKDVSAAEYTTQLNQYEGGLAVLQTGFTEAPADTRKQITEFIGRTPKPATTARERSAAAVNMCMLKTALRVFGGSPDFDQHR